MALAGLPRGRQEVGSLLGWQGSAGATLNSSSSYGAAFFPGRQLNMNIVTFFFLILLFLSYRVSGNYILQKAFLEN